MMIWIFAVMFAATPPDAPTPQWRDLVQEMLNAHPGMAVGQAAADAAQAHIQGADALPDPKLEVALYASEIETRVGPQRARVSVGQELPWTDKRRLKRWIAKADFDAATQRVAVTRDQLVETFTTLWAEYYFETQARDLASDHLALLTDLEAVVIARYKTNSTPYNDLIRLEIESERMRERIARHQDAALPLIAAVNGMLGRDPAQPLAEPETLPVVTAIEDASPSTTDQNPLLAQQHAREASARLKLQLAEAASRPDIRVGLDWIETGSAVTPNLPGSGRDALILKVGVDLPLWQRRYRAREAAAAAQLTQATEAVRAARLELDLQLERARFRRDEAARKLTLYRDRIVPMAREALEVGYTAYQTDEIGFTELIEAERALLTLLSEQFRAEADQVIAAAQILRLTGGSAKGGVHED